jgi:hypothetical protein
VVPHPRAALDAGTLRPVNAPVPLRVQTDANGRPLAVRRRGWPVSRAVVHIQDRWRIDDEWWREQPISRLYHELLLDNGRLITVYHDLAADAWFEQHDTGGSQSG